uniref:Major facilitator superfamily (MFS) profile domain-containing protein n=1 Tax=Hyaloperonospora arabidopsidis (strain Emoy2) TaxID=559515 RepID=M4BKS5_HYAAE
MAVASSMWSNLPLGLVLDKFGPRATKSMSFLLLIAGALIMGNARFRPAQFLDMLIDLSAIHVSNLFPEATAIVACFIVGGLQFSFFIFTLLDLAYTHLGMSMTTVFEAYACVLFLALVGTLMTEPDVPFEASTNVEHELLSPMHLPHAFKEGETSLLLSTPELEEYRKRHHLPTDEIFCDGNLRNRSFRTQVLSRPFLLIVFYFSIHCLWCNVFLGSITGLLRWKGFAETKIESLLAKLAFVLPGSVVFIPTVGYILDKCGYVYSSLICTAAALSFTLMLSSLSTGWILAGFVIYAFFRTTLFPLLFAYLGHRFGFQHYGALSGITFCIGGIVGLLQTPIAAIGDFHIIEYLQVSDVNMVSKW